jgi:hypothetical protein
LLCVAWAAAPAQAAAPTGHSATPPAHAATTAGAGAASHTPGHEKPPDPLTIPRGHVDASDPEAYLEVAPVVVDGQRLFEVGALLARSAPERARAIAARLVDAARDGMPVDVFEQEHLAMFNDAGSSPFDEADIRAMAGGWAGFAVGQSLGGLYLTAWDIGRKADATVGITIDYGTEPYQVVAFERMERVPYPEQQDAIAKRHAAFPGRTIVEDNGPGDPVVGIWPVKVESFTTGARNKVNAIQALRLLLERGALKADIPALTGELLAYQWDDRGIRQDCVMALAIAALHLPKPDRIAPLAPPIGPENRTAMGGYRSLEL